MPKRRKKKGTDAWQNLVRLHKKGPKRVKVSIPRSKNGVSPLTLSEHSKRIQIVMGERKIGVAVFNHVFVAMGLVPQNEYTMEATKLTRAGQLLRKTLEMFSHNDFIFGQLRELKLDNCVGKCIVMTGKIARPDALLIIEPTRTPVSSSRPTSVSKKVDANVEYM